jgi:hypothetical protein
MIIIITSDAGAINSYYYNFNIEFTEDRKCANRLRVTRSN